MNDPVSPPLSWADNSTAIAEPAEPRVGPDIDFADPNSPLAPYYLQASHVLATLLIVAIFLFFNLMTPLWHSDIWGHLKTGEWILANRQLPQRELFSPFSDPTLPASNFQWLSQVTFAGAFYVGEWLAGGSTLERMAGGIDMLRFVHALCEAAKALFLLLAYRRFCGSLPWASVGVLLVFVFSLAPSAVQRPQVFGEVLFAAVLWSMARPLRGDRRSAPLSWRRSLFLLGTFVLWANIHGSFLVGIALVGVFWLGQSIESLQVHGPVATLRDAPRHRPVFVGLLGVALLSLLNPHGVRAIPDVLAFAKNPNILTMQEWRPLDFSAGGGAWGYLVLFAIIVLTQIVGLRIYAPTQLLLLAFFGGAPLLQERMMTWWIVLIPVLLLPMWVDLVGVSSDGSERFTSILSLRKTIIAAGLVLIGVIWSSPVQLLLGHPPVPIHLSSSRATLWPITPQLLDGADLSRSEDKVLKNDPLAKALAAGLKEYPSEKFHGCIFTPEAMGDYLVWSLPPKAPVLVYSHVHAFAPDFWDDYMEVLFARPGWRTVLDRERVNLIVCQVEQRHDLLKALRDDPEWDVILDQSEQPLNRWYRLFAALRKKPLRNNQ